MADGSKDGAHHRAGSPCRVESGSHEECCGTISEAFASGFSVIRVRLRAADWRTPRPSHPSRPHPRDERRQLPASSLQAQGAPCKARTAVRHHPSGLKCEKRQGLPTSGASSTASVLHFYSGKPMYIYSGVDSSRAAQPARPPGRPSVRLQRPNLSSHLRRFDMIFKRIAMLLLIAVSTAGCATERFARNDCDWA